MVRNDVKLGLAVGGALLAVLIGYVILAPGSSSQQPGAQLAEGPSDASAPSPSGAESAEVSAATVIDPTAAVDDASSATSGSETQTEALVQKANGWDWGRILDGESVPPQLLSKTPVPANGSGRQLNVATSSESAGASSDAQDAAQIESSPAISSNDAGADPMAATPEDSFAPANDGAVDMASADPATSSGTLATPTTRRVASAAFPAASGSRNPVASSRTHVVQPDETMSSIAAAAYGRASAYPHIVRANPGVDPKRLKPGMTLILPAIADVNPQVAAANTPHVAHAGATKIDPRREYRVGQGESLYVIAKKLYGRGSRSQELYELNRQTIGNDPARLKVGMVLRLPEPPTAVATGDASVAH